MMTKAFHYCLSLALLIALAVGYNIGAAQYLRPPVVPTVNLPDAKPIEENSVADLFPEGVWQRGTCKRLQTDNAVILFKEWKQETDNQWKLWPITIVFGRGTGDEETEQTPVILEAIEGAELLFAESLDMSSSDAPPIRHGRIKGLVEIHRSPEDDDEQPLLLRTTNVGIDSSKIWTTEPIHMRLGDAKLIGRDLTLHLAASAGNDGAGTGPAAVLDRMDLVYLDQFDIPLENGSLWHLSKTDASQTQTPTRIGQPPTAQTQLARFGSVQPPKTATTTAPQASLSIRCAGHVEYDFAVDQLILRESISLIHDVVGGKQDHIDCDALEIWFREPASKIQNRAGPLDWLDRILVNGSPAVVNLQNVDARIEAERIDLDAVAGLLRADGRTGVKVKRGPFHANLKQLAYQYDPKQPKAIGTLDAFGSGAIVVNDPKIPVRQIQWKDQFRIQPIGDRSKTIDSDLGLWVDGDVKAKFVDGGDFFARAVEGWIKPKIVTDELDPEKVKRTYVPHAFQASGNVLIDSSSAEVKTQLLTLHFLDSPASVAVADSQTNQTPQRSLRQWVAQPKAEDGTVAPVARQRPSIRGSRVAAALRMNEDGISAKDLSVHDNVELTHTVTVGEQLLPAKLTGNKLRLVDDGGADEIQLDSIPGSPARLDLGDGFFVGPQIRVWPSNNLVRIDGAGEFQMPTAMLPATLGDNETSNIQWTRAPHCRWRGEMAFDGHRAVLTDGVDISSAFINRSEPWAVHMSGDRMEVVFLDDVQMNDVQSLRKAAIQQVILLQSAEHPVIVRAERRAGDGVLEARHVLHAPKLTLLPSGGGKLAGAGPGWYRSWVRAEKRGPFSPAKEKQNPSGEPALMGMHLVYHAALKGDLANQTLDFLRGVRVGIREVSDWQEVFDAKQMDSISEGDSTVDCDNLHVAVDPGYSDDRRIAGVPVPWEMQARGGVVFRTRSDKGLLEGTASRTVYSSAKDLFTVEGAPNRGAVIKRTNANGQPGFSAVVREVTIRPRTFEVQSSKVMGFTVGTLPSKANR